MTDERPGDDRVDRTLSGIRSRLYTGGASPRRPQEPEPTYPVHWGYQRPTPQENN